MLKAIRRFLSAQRETPELPLPFPIVSCLDRSADSREVPFLVATMYTRNYASQAQRLRMAAARERGVDRGQTG